LQFNVEDEISVQDKERLQHILVFPSNAPNDKHCMLIVSSGILMILYLGVKENNQMVMD
jgi:hypothetical protein